MAHIEKKSSDVLEFFDIIFVPLMSDFESSKMTNGVYIPPIIHDSELPFVRERLKVASETGIKYALLGNISHLSLSKEAGLVPIGDFRLNVTNSYAKDEYRKLGVKDIVLSPELSVSMARDIRGGEVVMGKIPLMLTERCFVKENFSCSSCMNAAFSDRTGTKFPIIREWQHRNIILNSIPTYMGDKKQELTRAKIFHQHFIFTDEKPDEVIKLIDSYEKGAPLASVRRIGSRGF